MIPFHLLCTDESDSRCAGQIQKKGNGFAGADHRPLLSAHPSWLLFFTSFAFHSCLCHCWWNETVPAAHSGWICAQFISSKMAHPYRPGHSQECGGDGSLKTELDGALSAPLCEEEQNDLLMFSSLTELHKRPASCSETDTVQLD